MASKAHGQRMGWLTVLHTGALAAKQVMPYGWDPKDNQGYNIPHPGL